MATETPWALRCMCQTAPVMLSYEEYMRQLNAPDRTWECPRCGRAALWDDAHHEKYSDLPAEEYAKYLPPDGEQ